MSLGNGPKIVTDALAFAFDMSSKQSWKGAPFKNELVSDTGWSGDGSNQTAFNKANVEITDTSLMYQGLPTRLWSPGTSRNCYLNSGDLNFSSLSTQWTFSCYVKREDGLPIASMSIYMYYPSSDGNAAASIQDMGNGWYKIWRTRTGANSYLGLVGFTGFSSNVRYYLSGPMLTKTQFPVHSTPAQVTRSNNEAIIDWAGKNVISPVDLEYSSDGSFKFNGLGERDASSLGSYLALPSAVTTTLPASKPDGVTYDVWLNVDVDAPNRVGLLVGGGTINHLELYSTSKYFRTEAVTQNGYSFGSGGFPDNCRGVWSNFIIVFANDEPNRPVRWYQNGKLFYTHSNMGSGNDADQYFSPIKLGSATGSASYLYADSFKGEISSFKVYNKTLSKAEVNSNFQALRSRHDL